MAEENHAGHNHDHSNGTCNGGCCGCGNGFSGRMGWFMLLRAVLIIIVVSAIFSFGVKIGELKGQLEAGGYGMRDYRDMPMQQGGMYFGQ